MARDITPSKGLNLSPSDGMEVEAKSPLRAILHSWKEIASELNRGVRTVQRWEQQLNMPVRRVSQGPRSPVFAFPAELHRWLRRKGAVMHSTGTLEGPRDAGLNAETRIKPNAELLRAIVNLFTMRSSRRAKENCSECGSPMQFLNGQFWIYGTRKKWKVSFPLCSVCNADMLSAHRHSQQIQ